MPPRSKTRSLLRPIVKWVGGKRQLLDTLLEHLPAPFRELPEPEPVAVPQPKGTYFEPFLGGGALLFSRSWPRAVAGDVNAELINVYRQVAKHVEALIALLTEHSRAHHADAHKHYYAVRALDPQTLGETQRAARFLYLNRTCYNGLYRVNRSGQFNVPMGRYKNPVICDAENLRQAAEHLRKVELRHAPFDQVCADARAGDLVYFDPPYDPLSSTANFTSYAADGFGWSEQEHLAQIFRDLSARGVYCLLSNANTERIRNLYADYSVHVVSARRAVSSRASTRGPVEEVLIKGWQE